MKRLAARFVLLGSLVAVVASFLPAASSSAQSADTLFEGEASIQAGHPFSLTDLEFALTCPAVPLSQDVDAHVFDLGLDTPAGATFTATGTDDLNTADVDAYFYDADCTFISGSEEIGDESGAVPAGTHYVNVVAFQGVNIAATLVVTGAADPDPTPTETPTPTPTGTPGHTRGSYPASPNDPLFGEQWGMSKVQAPQAWQEPAGTGFNTTVAIIDSGLDIGHPDFDCGDWKVKILPGANVIDPTQPPQDEDGHGTHVAGIIGACANNDEGVVGVAPDATIMPIQVLNADGGTLDDLIPAIHMAADNGAHVINMSLGPAVGPLSYVPGLWDDINDAINYAQSKGVVVVAAAGNDSTPICETPAIARDVICVGASDSGDLNAYYGTFPNKTGSDDPNPGLLAPGGQGTFCDESITSTFLRTVESVCHSAGYDAIDGTSMASPHVAGAAAVVYDALGGERSPENARKVIDAILTSADDLYTPGYDPLSGYGRLNVLKAVQAATS